MSTLHKDYMTTNEAARLLDVSLMRVRQFFYAGRITGFKIGNTLLLNTDSVVKFSRIKRTEGRPRKDF